MDALFSTFLAMLAAPALARAAVRWPRLLDGIDGFVLVGVSGIVVVHVAPEGYEAAGWPAVLAVAAGLVLASWSHHSPAMESARAALAVAALSIHSALDGLALGGPDSALGDPLAGAIVLHTLPVAVGVWRLASAHGGKGLATTLLLVMAGATALGFQLARSAAIDGVTTAMVLAQCLAAGAVLHVVFHFAHGRVLHPAMLGGGALGLLAVVLAG